MRANGPIGDYLKLSIRGASHARRIDATLENLPADFRVDEQALAAFMARRAPGRDALASARCESDRVVFDDAAHFHIDNVDARPADYGERTVPRPGHADYGQWLECGFMPTGGGLNSGRMTVALCAAGGICLQLLAKRGISISASLSVDDGTIRAAQRDGDSVGGIVHCEACGVPAGLGGALFAGLESALSAALFAIPGVKGVAFGNGFGATVLRGSENNDAFTLIDGDVRTKTNRCGGVLGGRSTGMPIVFDVAFKPTPTIFKPQESVDLATLKPAICEMKGRHDPCIARRAVPVVEAVAAFVLADLLLARDAATPRICLTLTGATLDEDLAQFEAQRLFTDMVELRVDRLAAEERVRAATFTQRVDVPVILTFRRACEGGSFTGDENERIAFFRRALAEANPPFAYVDFEESFRVDVLTALAKERGTRIIRSRHDAADAIPAFDAAARQLVAGTDEIAKIAFTPRTLDDVTRLFEQAQRVADVPHVFCAMGPMGLVTRILAAHTHSLWTYTSLGGLGDAVGHVSPHELVRTYRFRVLTPDTALYGVTGWPLAHTRSPELHNAAFAANDIDALMFPLPAIEMLSVLRFAKAMHVRGLAVTMPHKRMMCWSLLNAEPLADAIGAVNTIRCEETRFAATNTDAEGFWKAFSAFFGDLTDKRVAILGAGGAARAVAYALAEHGISYDVFHRTTPPTGYDALVNATPVDPIPDYVFTGSEAVYDLVYEPAETPLMARARAAGCRVENGFSMLKEQARLQRIYWGLEA